MDKTKKGFFKTIQGWILDYWNKHKTALKKGVVIVSLVFYVVALVSFIDSLINGGFSWSNRYYIPLVIIGIPVGIICIFLLCCLIALIFLIIYHYVCISIFKFLGLKRLSEEREGDVAMFFFIVFIIVHLIRYIIRFIQ